MGEDRNYKMKEIRFKLLRPDLPRDILPSKAHETDSGFDLKSTDRFSLAPGERRLVPCGFAMALPFGYEAVIRPRSGLAIKQGVTVLNTPGTIDCDYRGEVCVILINLGTEPIWFETGDRIAQMALQKVPQGFRAIITDILPETSRGTGGFGSTGR